MRFIFHRKGALEGYQNNVSEGLTAKNISGDENWGLRYRGWKLDWPSVHVVLPPDHCIAIILREDTYHKTGSVGRKCLFDTDVFLPSFR